MHSAATPSRLPHRFTISGQNPEIALRRNSWKGVLVTVVLETQHPTLPSFGMLFWLSMGRKAGQAAITKFLMPSTSARTAQPRMKRFLIFPDSTAGDSLAGLKTVACRPNLGASGSERRLIDSYWQGNTKAYQKSSM